MRIIVFMKNWLGDILFQVPALQLIRKNYPDAEIVCAAPARCLPILTSQPAVNRVFIFDEKSDHRFFPKRIAFAFQLRSESWDQGYLFHSSRTRSLLLALGGVKDRIGYSSDRKFLLTRAVPEPATPMHQVDYFLNLLEKAGLGKADDRRYQFYFSETDRQYAEENIERFGLSRYACFHLGANWEHKRWPVPHFAKLADMIWAKWQLPIVVTGGSSDLALARNLTELIQKARIVTMTAQTTLGQLGAIFKGSRFVVSGDSGPMHIASGVGARVACIFGPTDPDLTGPRGIGESVVLKYVPRGYSVPYVGEIPKEGWLTKIFPETVFQALESKGWGSV